MKKFLCFVLSLTMVVPFLSAFAADFSDVSAKLDPEIDFLGDTGVVEGRFEGIFAPDELVNRAEMLKILFDLAGESPSNFDITKYNNCFTDVTNEWFAPYVCYAKEEGFVSGYPDGSFKPGSSVNLVEALKMTFEAFQFDLVEDGVWYSKYYDAATLYDVYDNRDYEFGDLITRRDMAEIATRVGLAFMTHEKFDPEFFSQIKSSGKSLFEIVIGFEFMRIMMESGGGTLGVGDLLSRTELLNQLLSEANSVTIHDSVRKSDVLSIFQAVTEYGMDNDGTYPGDIYDGSLDSYIPSGVPVDPVTNKPYGYVVSDDRKSFEISATLDNGEKACSFLNLGGLVDPCEE